MPVAEEIIIVLGHKNLPENEEIGIEAGLSELARGRLDRAAELHKLHPSAKILTTGGSGIKMNTTEDMAHAHHAQDYLKQIGVAESAIIHEIAESYYTVDDALKAKPILEKHGAKKLTVITSDFHTLRASLIFDHYLPGYEKTYIGVETHIRRRAKVLLMQKENEKIAMHVKTGELPAESLQRISSAHQGYSL